MVALRGHYHHFMHGCMHQSLIANTGDNDFVFVTIVAVGAAVTDPDTRDGGGGFLRE